MTRRVNPLLISLSQITSVTVEYDGPDGRERKEFAGPKAVVASRAFYRRMTAAGRNPRVVAAGRG
jgi:hypothetical protein